MKKFGQNSVDDTYERSVSQRNNSIRKTTGQTSSKIQDGEKLLDNINAAVEKSQDSEIIEEPRESMRQFEEDEARAQELANTNADLNGTP